MMMMDINHTMPTICRSQPSLFGLTGRRWCRHRVISRYRFRVRKVNFSRLSA